MSVWAISSSVAGVHGTLERQLSVFVFSGDKDESIQSERIAGGAQNVVSTRATKNRKDAYYSGARGLLFRDSKEQEAY